MGHHVLHRRVIGQVELSSTSRATVLIEVVQSRRMVPSAQHGQADPAGGDRTDVLPLIVRSRTQSAMFQPAVDDPLVGRQELRTCERIIITTCSAN